MSIAKNEYKSAVLWHMNGCIATFYEAESEQQKKKVPLDTISFTNKAYLAFRSVNSLRIASPAVPYLENLSVLLLQNNKLKSLPHELWRLSGLEELNLGCNELQVLPRELGLLKNLRELFLHSNHLKDIPSQIGNLQHLTVLDVTDNQLTHLPAEITRMQLRNLWIDHNLFETTTTEDASMQMISLKDVCIQTIGLLCLSDEESREVVSELPPTVLDQSTVLPEDLDLLSKCYYCNTPIFHTGLNVVSNEHRAPVVMRACSQTCYVELYNSKAGQLSV